MPSPTSAFSTRRPEATRYHTAGRRRAADTTSPLTPPSLALPPCRHACRALRSCRPPAAGTSLRRDRPFFRHAGCRCRPRFAAGTAAPRPRSCRRNRNYSNFAHPTQPILVSSARPPPKTDLGVLKHHHLTAAKIKQRRRHEGRAGASRRGDHAAEVHGVEFAPFAFGLKRSADTPAHSVGEGQ